MTKHEPGATEIRYERNYLTKVIFRLDFQPILVLQNDRPIQFQERIRSRLPEFEEQHGIEFSSEIGPHGKRDQTAPVASWIFRDVQHRFQLTLNYRFFAIEDTSYTSLEDLVSILTFVMEGFTEAYSDVVYARIGLRYINEIRLPTGDPFDWDGYIAPHLTRTIEGMKPHSQLARAMSQTVINRDDYTVLINHGIFNSEFPAPISRREFVLDFDASSSEVDDKSVVDKVRSFNADLLETFESCIGDKLRADMGRKSR